MKWLKPLLSGGAVLFSMSSSNSASHEGFCKTEPEAMEISASQGLGIVICAKIP